MFSLGASLWSAADWLLTEAEKPSLSSSFQELLASMTNDGPDARPSLQDVLHVRKAKRFDFHLIYRALYLSSDIITLSKRTYIYDPLSIICLNADSIVFFSFQKRCDSLRTDGDMTSRERCQSLLWEYQAYSAMRKEDVSSSLLLR